MRPSKASYLNKIIDFDEWLGECLLLRMLGFLCFTNIKLTNNGQEAKTLKQGYIVATTAGIAGNPASETLIYTNPANQVIYIQANEDNPLSSVSVTDQRGR